MSDQGCREFQDLTRRRLLQAGACGLGGWSVRPLLGSDAAPASVAGIVSPRNPVRAKRCLLIFMWGGPSQLETWDPKPSAPADVRGEFQAISTNVPGIEIGEMLPKLAQHADKLAIVRSMTHSDPAHLSSVHHLMTGHLAPRVNSDADAPSRKDSPHIGSVLTKLEPPTSVIPPFISMPWTVMHPAAPGGTAPGQNAGWLGPAYDPFLIQGDPNSRRFEISGLSLSPGLNSERMASRQQLQQALDQSYDSSSEGAFDLWQTKALEMLTTPAIQDAFKLFRESKEMRQRYGRHIHGQCLLLARRLFEAGTRFITVNWHQDHANFWDTHGDNFNSLKKRLAPPADTGFATLLEDLSERGMLDDTLIVWVGEFGRRPQITKNNAGREHWPWCYSAVLAGGGIRGGQVYGRSDRLAAYPTETPVSPADLTATMYHAMGYSSETVLRNFENRPMRLTAGEPLTQLFG